MVLQSIIHKKGICGLCGDGIVSLLLEIYFDGGFDTLEEARERLCAYVKGTMVEYLDFDPNVDCK